MRKIKFYFEDTKTIRIGKNFLREAIEKIIENEEHKLDDINIIFCNDGYLLDINKKFLHHDYYTDIITFDNSKEKSISGELYISIDRIDENAKKYHEKKKVELIRVIFHGILHLLGYNDKAEDEITKMRKKENYYLEMFDVR